MLCKNQYINLIIKKRSASKLKNYYKEIISDNTDLAIFIGGAIIQDTFAVYLDLISSLLAEKDVPIIFSGIGIGLQSKITKNIFKKIFYNSNILGVSCRCAKERFEDYIFHDDLKILSTFDIAVVASDYFLSQAKRSSSIIGLGVMYSSRYPISQIKLFWLDIIRDLNNRNIEWKIFTTGSYKDNVLATELINAIGGKRDSLVIPKSVEQLICAITSFSRVLSFRLHSHIICYSYGIPSVGIKWDGKIKDFFEKTNKSFDYFDISDNPRIIVDRLLQTQSQEKDIYKVKDITYKIFDDIVSNGIYTSLK